MTTRSRLFGLLALVLTASLARAEVLPETLLSPTTQAYYRWDGVAAHRTAYAKSARGQMLAGDTGRFLADVYQRLLRDFSRKQFGDPLLAGSDVDRLAAQHAVFRSASKVPEVLAETGLVVGFEVRIPFDFRHVPALLGVNRDSGFSLKSVDLQLTVIVPNGAGRPELTDLLRLLVRNTPRIEKLTHLGRQAEVAVVDEVWLAWWAEGKHLAITLGSVKTKTAIERMAKAGDGLTKHPLYQQLARPQKFEVVSKVFVDTASLVGVMKQALTFSGNGFGTIVPEIIGLTGLQTFRMWEGFDGDESRSVTELDTVGPRAGFTKLYKAGKLDLKDLPPLPADVHRWSAGVFDLGAVYDVVLDFASLFAAGFIEESQGKSFRESVREARVLYEGLVEDTLGVRIPDLIASLDDLGVSYQSPSDGLMLAGQVFAIRIKDEAAFHDHFGRLVQGIEKAARDEIKSTRRMYQGVELREFSLKGNAVTRPTVAVCDGWMVAGFYPQSVTGFILRSKGKLPRWRPDERTAKTLASIPPGPAAVQYADPRPTLRLHLGAAQPFFGYLSTKKETKDLFDPAMLPNADEVCRPLFPNINWTHNLGKTIRWENRESLAMPLEVFGLDSLVFAYLGQVIK